MTKNAFLVLQKVGRSLLLPISVLPIAGLLLGVGAADFSWLPEVVSNIMSHAGGSVFANMPLIFAIGVALGFSNNDGVSALAAVVAYGIMVKTLTVMVALLMGISEEMVIQSKLADTGVLGGIIAGAIGSYMFNRFYRIQLPEYLGFFAGKRFVPIAAGLTAILVAVVLSFVWPYIAGGIKSFSDWAAYQNPLLAFGIYGVVERALIPFGLHHIWNAPFQMQIGEFVNAAGHVFHGDIPRYMAGDPTAGKLSGGFLFKMYGLPAAAIAIWHCAKPENKAKVGGIMISAALTSFLTGITEPIEFAFLFVAPVLYVIHVFLSGLAFVICILLDMRDGTSFSHGLIDFIVLSGNSHRIWLFPIIGIIYALIYYSLFRFFIIKFNLATPGRDDCNNALEDVIEKGEAFLEAIICAYGGPNNMKNLDACITRLRIMVVNVEAIDKAELKRLGAKGVIVIGSEVQAIFGARSDSIKLDLLNYMQKFENKNHPA